MSANGNDAEFDGNFDRERIKTLGKPHEFVVGEKTFRFRKGVEQETIDSYFDEIDNTEAGSASLLAKLDETILRFLVPGQEEDWNAVRHEIEQPVLVGDMMGIVSYMMAVMTGRPTVRLSGSGDTPGQPGTSLTDPSPSPEAATSTP